MKTFYHLSYRFLIFLVIDYACYVGGTVIIDHNEHIRWPISFSEAKVSSTYFLILLILGIFFFTRYYFEIKKQKN